MAVALALAALALVVGLHRSRRHDKVRRAFTRAELTGDARGVAIDNEPSERVTGLAVASASKDEEPVSET